MEIAFAAIHGFKVIARFCSDIYGFVQNNSDELNQLQDWAINIRDGKDAYIANKKYCLKLAESVSLLEEDLRKLQSKHRTGNLPKNIAGHLKCLNECLIKCRELIKGNIMPSDLNWVRKQAWIIGKVMDSKNIQGNVAELVQELNNLCAHLSFSLQIATFSSFELNEDASALEISEIKEFIERQNMQQHANFTAEFKNMYTDLSEDLAKNSDKMTFAMENLLNRHFNKMKQEIQTSLAAAKRETNNNNQENEKNIKPMESIANALVAPDITAQIQSINYESGSLGSGTAATVYKGIYTEGSRDGTTVDIDIAFKEFDISFTKCPTEEQKDAHRLAEMRRIQREAKLMWIVNGHPNSLLLYGVSKNPLGLAFEYCNKGNLQEQLWRAQRITPNARNAISSIEFVPVSSEFHNTEPNILQIINCCQQILNGIQFLHAKGIIHRDIKSPNILVHEQSAGLFVYKIADFGSASMINPARTVTQSHHNATAGTYRWQAPELFSIDDIQDINERKQLSCNPGIDIYSVGLVIAELFLRKPPFALLTNNNAIMRAAGRQAPFDINDFKQLRKYSITLCEMIEDCCKINPFERASIAKITLFYWPKALSELVGLQSPSILSNVTSGGNYSNSTATVGSASDAANIVGRANSDSKNAPSNSSSRNTTTIPPPNTVLTSTAAVHVNTERSSSIDSPKPVLMERMKFATHLNATLGKPLVLPLKSHSNTEDDDESVIKESSTSVIPNKITSSESAAVHPPLPAVPSKSIAIHPSIARSSDSDGKEESEALSSLTPPQIVFCCRQPALSESLLNVVCSEFLRYSHDRNYDKYWIEDRMRRIRPVASLFSRLQNIARLVPAAANWHCIIQLADAFTNLSSIWLNNETFGVIDTALKLREQASPLNRRLMVGLLYSLPCKELRLDNLSTMKNAFLVDGAFIPALNLSAYKLGVKGTTAFANNLMMYLLLLKSLSLYNNNIGDDGCIALAKNLTRLSQLQHLDLGYNGIGIGGFSVLIQQFKYLKLLNSLNLEMNNLSNTCEIFAEHLKDIPLLTNLKLARCIIHDAACEILAEHLNSVPLLTHLDLSRNYIGGLGCRKLIKNLICLPQLNILNLSFNNIGDPLGRLNAFGLDAFAELKNMNQLQILNLSDNKIGDRRSGELLKYLMHLNSLDDLDLGGNGIGDAGCIILAENLKYVTKLSSLNLWHNDIGKDGIRVLAENMEQLTELNNLNLNWNKLGIEGCEILAKNLCHMKFVFHLQLAYNKIGADGCSILAENLKELILLSILDLEGNDIGDYGCGILARNLKNNPLLFDLNLSNNNIGADGCLILAAELHEIPGLNRLLLGNNRLGNADIGILAENLKELSNLRSVDLSGNNIGYFGRRTLTKALKDLPVNIDT